MSGFFPYGMGQGNLNAAQQRLSGRVEKAFASGTNANRERSFEELYNMRYLELFGRYDKLLIFLEQKLNIQNNKELKYYLAAALADQIQEWDLQSWGPNRRGSQPDKLPQGEIIKRASTPCYLSEIAQFSQQLPTYIQFYKDNEMELNEMELNEMGLNEMGLGQSYMINHMKAIIATVFHKFIESDIELDAHGLPTYVNSLRGLQKFGYPPCSLRMNPALYAKATFLNEIETLTRYIDSLPPGYIHRLPPSPSLKRYVVKGGKLAGLNGVVWDDAESKWIELKPPMQVTVPVSPIKIPAAPTHAPKPNGPKPGEVKGGSRSKHKSRRYKSRRRN